MISGNRIISFCRMKVEPVQRWLKQYRLPITLAAATLFLVGMVWSIKTLKIGFADLAVGPLAILSFILVPLSLVYGGLGLQLLAKVAGLKMEHRFAFRSSAFAQLAEILPLPGGAIVRTGALMSIGAKAGEGTMLVLAAAFLWISIAAAGAGYAVHVAGAQWGLGFFALGLLVAAAILIWIAGKAGLSIGLQILVHRLVGLILTGLRIACAFAIIGITLPIESSMVFAFATIVGSAASIAPAGLGISEALSGALAPIVSVAPAAAFLAIALNRIIGLSVTAFVVLITSDMSKPATGSEAIE